MPDRDPALEAAVERFLSVGMRRDRLEQGSAFRAGWGSALRSLGAGTPEAVAALRELVTAVLAESKARKDYERAEQMGYVAEQCERRWEIAEDADVDLSNAADTFAALATPTEEGT